MKNDDDQIRRQQWSNDIKEYQHNKNKLEWGVNPQPLVRTYKMIKTEESSFNPILQYYNNTSIEENLRNSYNKNLVTQLAKNKVLLNKHNF